MNIDILTNVGLTAIIISAFIGFGLSIALNWNENNRNNKTLLKLLSTVGIIFIFSSLITICINLIYFIWNV